MLRYLAAALLLVNTASFTSDLRFAENINEQNGTDASEHESPFKTYLDEQTCSHPYCHDPKHISFYGHLDNFFMGGPAAFTLTTGAQAFAIAASSIFASKKLMSNQNNANVVGVGAGFTLTSLNSTRRSNMIPHCINNGDTTNNSIVGVVGTLLGLATGHYAANTIKNH